MESHWHWMPGDFFFNHTCQAGGFGNLQSRYNEVEMQTWKYGHLHNSKGLLIAARHSSRGMAAAAFSFIHKRTEILTFVDRGYGRSGGGNVRVLLEVQSLLAFQHFAPREMGLFSGFTGCAAACGVAIVLCHFTGDSHHYTRACWRQSTRRCWRHSKCMIFSLVQTNRFKRSV